MGVNYALNQTKSGTKILNSAKLFSLGTHKALLCKHFKPARTKTDLKRSQNGFERKIRNPQKKWWKQTGWIGIEGEKLQHCQRDETVHTVRRWVILGRWGNRAGVGEGASSLAHHTVCALPAPSQNATCWYPVCPGRLGSMQLAPFHSSLHGWYQWFQGPRCWRHQNSLSWLDSSVNFWPR